MERGIQSGYETKHLVNRYCCGPLLAKDYWNNCWAANCGSNTKRDDKCHQLTFAIQQDCVALSKTAFSSSCNCWMKNSSQSSGKIISGLSAQSEAAIVNTE